MSKFKLESKFKPSGDQPQAIAGLVKALNDGESDMTLLGVTGSGKTFTMANVIQQVQKPTLVISHNKTLAAQLASEFREFFPGNAVHYFVSYYDYYQPEAYMPRTDTYIEKETDINDEIERLRHAATEALMMRDDVIIVASVSCIYGIARPEDYKTGSLGVTVKEGVSREKLLIRLVEMNYDRNDVNFFRGTFRVRGDVVEVYPPSSDKYVIRFEYFGDDLEFIKEVDALTGEVRSSLDEVRLFPATLYISQTEYYKKAIGQIRADLEVEAAAMKKAGKEYEARRLEQRVNYDLEMIENTGYTNGIENYSRYFDGRQPGEPAYTLIDYFGDDFLVIIDESHQTIPQIGGMFNGDRARKEMLVEHGFRLKAAFDNRPLRFEEFEKKIKQAIYTTATPGEYEREHSGVVVEQLLRPTGITEPTIDVRPVDGQVHDLMKEIEKRVEKHERVLVTTLTKRMAEELADFMNEKGIKVQYLHSEVDTMERIEILRDLRLGTYDVLVGINLLREGLDLPEVSLVAILDADKEGFLRSETSLVQVMGRAARHLDGSVIMYADTITGSMKRAMDEVNRRRHYQEAYNKEHGITPQTIKKRISEDRLGGKKKQEQPSVMPATEIIHNMRDEEYAHLVDDMQNQMSIAAQNLEFERAAMLRDQLQMLEETRPVGILKKKTKRKRR
ncbi:MAG: excinuclease ABC subunit UvrB [Candidatus Kerfeldbacteria bacterium]